MPTRQRNFRVEYARRIANAQKLGRSRSQARGHPKAAESSVRAVPGGRPIEDARLQLGLKVLRQKRSLSAAAREARISPERLRRRAIEKNLIEKHGRRWSVRHDLPRRMLLYTRGQAISIVVGDFDSASRIGRFMAAVGKFLTTNNPAGLAEFAGQSVRDVSGVTHVFETRPNALYRITSFTDQTFEQIYRIVI
jgi:hypothetical protein